MACRPRRYSRRGQGLGQAAQAPVGGNPDRARAPAHYPAHRLVVQAGQHPQHDHFRLQGRQGQHRLEHRGRGQVFQGQRLRIGGPGFPAVRHVIERGHRVTGPAAALIDGTPAGDREQPRSPGPLVPLEAGQTPADLHPDFRRDVLGRFRRGHPQVAQQIRVTVTPQHRERGFVARLGGCHNLRKVVTDHRWEYRDQLTAPQPDCQDQTQISL
jgi:hypothetical protein